MNSKGEKYEIVKRNMHIFTGLREACYAYYQFLLPFEGCSSALFHCSAIMAAHAFEVKSLAFANELRGHFQIERQ